MTAPVLRRGSTLLAVVVVTAVLSGCDADIDARVEGDAVSVSGTFWTKTAELWEEYPPQDRSAALDGCVPARVYERTRPVQSDPPWRVTPLADAAKPDRLGCRVEGRLTREQVPGLVRLDDRYVLKFRPDDLATVFAPEDAVRVAVSFPGVLAEADPDLVRADDSTVTLTSSAAARDGVRVLARPLEPVPLPFVVGLATATGVAAGALVGRRLARRR